MGIELTKEILEAKQFKDEAEATEVAHWLGVELLGTHPKATSFILGVLRIHIVRANDTYYLKELG